MDNKGAIDTEYSAKARSETGRDMLAEALLKTGTGDRAAFEYLYRNTSAKLFGVCLRKITTKIPFWRQSILVWIPIQRAA